VQCYTCRALHKTITLELRHCGTWIYGSWTFNNISLIKPSWWHNVMYFWSVFIKYIFGVKPIWAFLHQLLSMESSSCWLLREGRLLHFDFYLFFSFVCAWLALLCFMLLRMPVFFFFCKLNIVVFLVWIDLNLLCVRYYFKVSENYSLPFHSLPYIWSDCMCVWRWEVGGGWGEGW
jgi:hypothetical protein